MSAPAPATSDDAHAAGWLCHQSGGLRVNCNCLAVTNGQLREKNLQLLTSWQIEPFRTHYQLHTAFIDKSRVKRGQKPTPVLATFCPFCGTRLHPDDSPRDITSGQPISK